MNEYLSFRKMITPLLIQVFFWIGVVVAVISALVMMVKGSFFVGLVALVVGPLIVRIECELLILLFRMYDELASIRQALGGQPPVIPQGFQVVMPSTSPATPPATPAP
jgi:hypothetical protein